MMTAFIIPCCWFTFYYYFPSLLFFSFLVSFFSPFLLFFHNDISIFWNNSIIAQSFRPLSSHYLLLFFSLTHILCNSDVYCITSIWFQYSVNVYKIRSEYIQVKFSATVLACYLMKMAHDHVQPYSAIYWR